MKKLLVGALTSGLFFCLSAKSEELSSSPAFMIKCGAWQAQGETDFLAESPPQINEPMSLAAVSTDASNSALSSAKNLVDQKYTVQAGPFPAKTAWVRLTFKSKIGMTADVVLHLWNNNQMIAYLSYEADNQIIMGTENSGNNEVEASLFYTDKTKKDPLQVSSRGWVNCKVFSSQP